MNIEKLDASHDEYGLDEDPTNVEGLIDRDSILEKYGIREMDEEDVDGLLGEKDGNSLNNKEVENMERILAKKIHNDLMSLSNIKKAAVEVLIENSNELYGIINIIVEYEPKGFLGRILGNSNKNNLHIETIEVTQIKISEIFQNNPEVVENFEINVESF
ncbi:hypothetical protein [Methanobacterium oryzae]|uniref:hypothetical protein n=1 Tax=Methanobacterium oryzae TaxID=69540 RepID=UPI003D21029B